MNENPAPSARGRKTVVVVLVAALVAAAVWIAILLMQQAGGPGQDGPDATGSPSSPGPSATSMAPSPTASASDLPGTPPASLPAGEAATVIWPDPGGALRYGTPQDAAGGFAEDFAGFTDPVYGEFMQGDSRSGELEVRPVADGAVTTVLLRQLSDGQWYAIGAASSEIQLDVPVASALISSPVALSGSSRAFEATVNVEVHAHGTVEPLGTGIVMGGSGPDLAPFSGSIQWENPGTGTGVLLLFVSSAQDGSVWTAAAVPVGFTAQP